MIESAPQPLVDIAAVLDDNSSDNFKEMVGKSIVEHFQQTGYVYLSNHGLTIEDVQTFINATDQFFDLNEDVKIKYKRSVETFHGYSTEKEEVLDSSITRKSKASRNSFDCQSLHEPFPDEEVPSLRPAYANIQEKLFPTVIQLLNCLELGLGIKKGTLVDAHSLMKERGSLTEIRSIRYMPPAGEEQYNRLEAHFDVSTITLQLYGDLEGLELLDKQGNWQKSKLYPGFILLFPSQIMERYTGDIIKATKHRVVIPEDIESRNKERHAVILFLHPDDASIIKPFCGTAYKPISALAFAEQYAKIYYKALYDNKTSS